MAELEKNLTKTKKSLITTVTSVNGIEKVASIEDEAFLTISFGQMFKHSIQMRKVFEQFHLPEQKLCSAKFEILLSDVILESDKLIFTLKIVKQKSYAQYIWDVWNYLHGPVENVEDENEVTVGTAEVIVKDIAINDGRHITLYFNTATVNVNIQWQDSGVRALPQIDASTAEIAKTKRNFLEIELEDLREYFWPRSKKVSDKENEDRKIVKLLDDRCVVPYLVTKFTHIDEHPLNHIRETMKAKQDYLTDQPSISKPDDESDALENLGEAMKWKFDFTIALQEEFGCNTFWFSKLKAKDLKNMEIIILKKALDQHNNAKDAKVGKKKEKHKDEKNQKDKEFMYHREKRRAVDFISEQAVPIPENIPYLYKGRGSFISALKQINWGHSQGPFLYNKRNANVQ